MSIDLRDSEESRGGVFGSILQGVRNGRLSNGEIRRVQRQEQRYDEGETARLLNAEEREQGRNREPMSRGEAQEIITSARDHNDRLLITPSNQPGEFLISIPGRRGAVEITLDAQAQEALAQSGVLARGSQMAPPAPAAAPAPATTTPAPIAPAADVNAGQTQQAVRDHMASVFINFGEYKDEPGQRPQKAQAIVQELRETVGADGKVRLDEALSLTVEGRRVNIPAGTYNAQQVAVMMSQAVGITADEVQPLQRAFAPAGAAAAPAATPPAPGAAPAAAPRQPDPAEQPGATPPAAANSFSIPAPEGGEARHYAGRAGAPAPAREAINIRQNQVAAVQQMMLDAGLDIGSSKKDASGKTIPDEKWGPASQASFERMARDAGIDPTKIDFTNLDDPETKQFMEAARNRPRAAAAAPAAAAPAAASPAATGRDAPAAATETPPPPAPAADAPAAAADASPPSAGQAAATAQGAALLREFQTEMRRNGPNGNREDAAIVEQFINDNPDTKPRGQAPRNDLDRSSLEGLPVTVAMERIGRETLTGDNVQYLIDKATEEGLTMSARRNDNGTYALLVSASNGNSLATKTVSVDGAGTSVLESLRTNPQSVTARVTADGRLNGNEMQAADKAAQVLSLTPDGISELQDVIAKLRANNASAGMNVAVGDPPVGNRVASGEIRSEQQAQL